MAEAVGSGTGADSVGRVLAGAVGNALAPAVTDGVSCAGAAAGGVKRGGSELLLGWIAGRWVGVGRGVGVGVGVGVARGVGVGVGVGAVARGRVRIGASGSTGPWMSVGVGVGVGRRKPPGASWAASDAPKGALNVASTSRLVWASGLMAPGRAVQAWAALNRH
ncbi:hypothetical protein GCM10011515_17430 [Tsuneonella deserti]|uniref:Uncharacterized protein n=1 Tax=Tsuneonella deserti TaxID=2035528 RepID=A0ABQ1S8H6_9SPHN|nr:hypothetical protein GCM10011515_17430 [Tsuneonella deserti]